MKSKIHEHQKSNRKIVSKNILLTCLTFAILLFSCSKDDPSAPATINPIVNVINPPVNNSIIAAGMASPVIQTPGNTIQPRPIIWRDGVATYLTPVVNNAEVAVSFDTADNVTYVAGYGFYPSSGGAAATGPSPILFVNSTLVKLPKGNDLDGEAKMVKFANGVPYTVGFTIDALTDNNVATLWRGISNPTVTRFPVTNAKTFANCVDVIGNDVYVVGRVEKFAESNLASLWKNGTQYNLTTNPAYKTEALGVDVQGTKVFITGYQEINGVCNARLWIWEGGAVSSEIGLEPQVEGTDVPVPGVFNGTHGLSVFSTGSLAYVFGNSLKDANSNWARVWRVDNGVVTATSKFGDNTAPQTDVNNYTSSRCDNGHMLTGPLVVSGSVIDQVASGVIFRKINGVEYRTPTVWKNGVKYSLESETNPVNNGRVIGAR